MFWDTLPGLVAAWTAAVVGLAAASKGVEYLARRAFAAGRFGYRAARGARRLIRLADEERWPNGAKSLPDAMNEIYVRQGETHDLIKSHLAESQQLWLHHLEEYHGEVDEP